MLVLTAEHLLILALATWRLSAMASYEVGPWRIFIRLRGLAGIQSTPDGAPEAWPDTFLASLLTCVWCVSVWVGAAFLALYYLWPSTIWLAAPLAISAGAIIVERFARG